MSCVIIYPMELSPVPFSDPPENMTGSHIRFLFGLASDGVYMASSVTRETVVSYTAFPPLPEESKIPLAVSLCCTIPGVTSAGRYPAPCPAKPGLSSPAAFRQLQPRSPVLLASIYYIIFFLKRKNFFYLIASAAEVASSSHRSF